jgi:hypothetical protein
MNLFVITILASLVSSAFCHPPTATVGEVFSDVENVYVRNEATRDDLSIQTCLNNGNFNLYYLL